MPRVCNPCHDGPASRPPSPRQHTTLDQVLGCIPYDGPPFSIEAMDEAVQNAAREMSGRV